jgi:hypothetical protein
VKIFAFDEIKNGLAGKRGVYWILNLENGNRYIGRGYIASRWSRHRRELIANIHWNLHLQSAFNKYGKDNFVFMFYHEESDDKIAYEIEKLQIAYHRQSSLYEVYNSKGDDPDNPRLGTKWSQEEYKKRKESGFSGQPFKLISPEGQIIEGKNLKEFCRNNNLLYNCINRVAWRKRYQYRGWRYYGETHPEYACPIQEYLRLVKPTKFQNYSKARKGKTLSEEHKQKMREIMTGRQFSPEWKQNISISAKKRGITEQFRRQAKKNGMKKAQSLYLYNQLEDKIYFCPSKEELIRKFGLKYKSLALTNLSRSKTNKYQIWRLCSPLKV